MTIVFTMIFLFGLLPDAQTIKSYQDLGNTGILLLVLVAVTVAWNRSNNRNFAWVKDFGAKHLHAMDDQTKAMVRNEGALREQIQSSDDLRSTVLQTLSCSAKVCPAREARRMLYGKPGQPDVSAPAAQTDH